MGLSIDDLEALYECVEIVDNLVEAGAENSDFLAVHQRAVRASIKIRAVIKRRKNRKAVRDAVKMARKILEEADNGQRGIKGRIANLRELSYHRPATAGISA